MSGFHLLRPALSGIIAIMQRKIDFSIGEHYHIYSRGTDKRIIFTEHHDYQRFKALLYVCNSTSPVDIAKHFREGRTFVELFEIERKDTCSDTCKNNQRYSAPINHRSRFFA